MSWFFILVLGFLSAVCILVLMLGSAGVGLFRRGPIEKRRLSGVEVAIALALIAVVALTCFLIVNNGLERDERDRQRVRDEAQPPYRTMKGRQ